MGIFNRTSKAATTGTAVAEAPAGPDLAHLTGDYTIDASHSRIGFAVRHAMVTNVRGQFAGHDGLLHLDGSSTGELHRRADHQGRQHRHRQHPARRAPAHRRLLRGGDLPGDHLPLHLGRAAGRRLVPDDR